MGFLTKRGLIREGRIVDSGRRRDGRIVWITAVGASSTSTTN
jgi:hypothetical protein